MGKMKDLHIDMMNEDWERIYLQEQIFKAEELARLQKLAYLEQLDQEAKIITDDNNKEVQTVIGHGARHEHASDFSDDIGEARLIRADGDSSISEGSGNNGKEECNSQSKG
jgi:hypothetical protein